MTTINAVIVAHHERIIAAWMSDVGHSPLARGLTRRELTSTIPAYLQSLGRCVADRPVQLDGVQHHILDRHLSSRVRQGYTLDGVLTEFALLGRALSREVNGMVAAERPTPADITRVFAELYLTGIVAANLFDEQLVEEHDRRRPDHLLRQLVAPSDRTDASLSVRGRLDDFLDIVVGVMGAQTAALFLLDVTGQRLVLSACVGDASGALEEYVTARDGSTLPGKIASSEGGPTILLDASTTDLRISDSLRQSGIHSLLGVRLEEQHRLRGVLYIGIRGQRGFTGAEVSRLEILSRALWPLLDSLRLQEALCARHEDLAIEQEIREHMVSVLTRDLAAPLSGALRSAGAIWARVTGEDHERAARIICEVERIKAMVDGLIDIHRVRAGQPLELHLRHCDLLELATAAAAELRSSHDHQIVLQATGRVEGIWDPERLRRVLHDLMQNAIEHGPPGVPIRVTVTRSVSGAEVVIHDEGPVTPGRALEVAILVASGQADAHGGRLSVDRDAERGTALRLMVPLDATRFVDPDPDAHDA